MKSGAGLGDPPQAGPNGLKFQTVIAKWIKFSLWVDIKNKLNLTKIGDAPTWGLQNSKFLST